MQKRGKPSLPLGVVLPIVLLEIMFIAVSILSFAFLSLGFAIAFTVIFGSIFFLGCLVSIIIYIVRYFFYENSLYPKGNLNALSLIGFIIIASGCLLNVLIGWIPLIGTIFSIFFGLMIITGGVLCVIALSKFGEGEKGRGLANIGIFISIEYLVHLIIVIITAAIFIPYVASSV